MSPPRTVPWAFDAVLFDMDGTLVETESIWFAAEQQVVARLGGTWLPEHQELYVGGPLDSMVAHMVELTGTDAGEQAVLDDVLATMIDLLTAGPVPWMPGARELVIALRERDVPIALVSASLRPMVDAVLAHIDRDHVAMSVSGSEVENSKPHPEPFLRAAELIGVDPTRCLAVEDSPTGVASARAAGCTVLAVPSIRAVEPADRVHVVRALSDLTLEDLAALAPRG
jgi:HAD superfamily hydrolase (TIGR01509 family)